MKKVWYASLCVLILFACNKKEPAAAEKAAEAVMTKMAESGCSKEIITDKPVKAGETGITLPVSSKLCFTADQLEIRVELPPGYSFESKGSADKSLPVYATYTCNCSVMGSACNVFYADGLGFGCLQSSCSGSCTGRFTYRGYTADKVNYTGDKDSFFNEPDIQKEIAAIDFDGAYSKQTIYGVSFYLVANEKIFLSQAKCDCEGTAACKLRTISLAGHKLYFCDGNCNGCELTVNK